MTNNDSENEVALTNSFFQDEAIALKSIYEDKLTIEEKNGSTILSMMLFPATADDIKSQFVRLLLKLSVKKHYPDSPVEVRLPQSRGLSDEQLRKISSHLNNYALENVGTSVLFDLIEMAKDSLTFNNLPSCPCPVCLEDFRDFDDFLKTECYHYLHSYCMYQYVVHWKEESKKDSQSLPLHFHHVPELTNQRSNAVPCPVCRKPISYDFKMLSCSEKPIEIKADEFNFDRIKEEMKRMEEVFQRQKEKGGIIDLEVEKNKYLLSNIAQAYAQTSSSPSVIQNSDDMPNSSDANHPISSQADNPPGTRGATEDSSLKPADVHLGSNNSNPKLQNETLSKSRDLASRGARARSRGSRVNSRGANNRFRPNKSHCRQVDSQSRHRDPCPKARDFSDVLDLKSTDASNILHLKARDVREASEHRHRGSGRNKRQYNERRRQEPPVAGETHSSNRFFRGFSSPSHHSSHASRGFNRLRYDKRSNRSADSVMPRRSFNDSEKHFLSCNSTSKQSFNESRTKTSFGKDVAE